MKVRIPVGICSKGHWAATGSHETEGDPDWLWDALDSCVSNGCGGPGKEHLIYVEAEVPLPPPPATVEGKAEEPPSE
jgi:hypothetical protein